MKAEMIPVEKLMAHPKNSRTHSREQIVALGRALKEWDFLQPVVADEDLVILIGHGRVEAAKEIGMAEVPVIVRKGLSEQKKRALIISDNRLAEAGSSWDQGVLTDELRYLLDEDFDLTLTAFDLPEMPDEGESDEDVEAEPEIITRPGDVWLMGAHRLACGVPDAAVMAAACGPLKPGLAVFRAPYNSDGAELDAALLDAALGSLDVVAAYVWHEPMRATPIAEMLQAAGYEIRSQIIRIREDASGTGRYRREHDPCWYAVRKGEAAGWLGGRAQSTCWEIGEGRHLPVDCWKRPILNHLASGKAMIDPFAGAGTGLIAAHQTARVFLGAEFDAGLVDRAILRWQAFTGLEATHEKTGASWSEVGEDRIALDPAAA